MLALPLFSERMNIPHLSIHELSQKLFGEHFDELDSQRQLVTQHLAERTQISRNIEEDYNEQLTFGQRLADKVASFGGSWSFIMSFAAVLVAWVVLNSVILARSNQAFDPFPYILLNLFLSMLASVQAPLILMSQNRQAQKDRLTAQHDYEVNLKAELEIMALHEKLDLLREKQWQELIGLQQEQLRLLSSMMAQQSGSEVVSTPADSAMPNPAPSSS